MTDRDSGTENPVISVLPLVDGLIDNPTLALLHNAIDTSNTDNLMKTLSRNHCHYINDELLENYLDYFIQSGFLHPRTSVKLTALRVSGYEISGSRFDKHVSYTIKVNHGTTSWTVKRRYKSFVALEGALRKELESSGYVAYFNFTRCVATFFLS